MKDKNGKEILDGMFLRIKRHYGDERILLEGTFKVELNPWEGVRLIEFRKDEKGKLVYCGDLSWRWGDLCYARLKEGTPEGRLAISDTWRKNLFSGGRSQENHYSEDIEIIKEEEI